MPSPGDQWCSTGTVNGGVADFIVLEPLVALPGGLELVGAFDVILAALGILVYASSSFCGNPPRYPGSPTLQDIADFGDFFKQPAVLDKYRQLIAYWAYPIYCTCTAYVPPATVYPPPPPNPPPPPGLPGEQTPPDLTCNLSGIASQLNAVLALLNLIASATGPHSYMLGASHTVSGTGEITVSGVVGCIFTVLTSAPGAGEIVSDPNRYFDYGWIAFGDPNGWYAHQPNLHSPQFHVQAPTGVSRIGYDTRMATSAEIVELLPNALYRGN